MQRTRLIAAAAAVALVGLGLTGCSTSGTASGGSGSTVSYMTWESNSTNSALDATMKKFDKSSGITVKREAAPNADYAQKLASLILAKKAPDFFWCTTAEAQNLQGEGLLYDWSSKLASGSGLKSSGFAPGSLSLWKSSDGKVAGIPTLANTYGFFYDADTFKSAGLAVPKAGWTWDDLFSDIAKLKTANPSSTPLVNQWPLLTSPQGASAYSVSNGGKPFVNSFVHATSVQADSTLTEGVKKFTAAISAGQMTNPDYDATNAMAAFSNGSVPLMFGGQWLQNFIAPNKPTFDWGFAPWPAGSASNVQPIEANGVCSPSTIKDPDAVWKTISYLDTTGFNDAMKAEPVAPIAYTAGSKGYYASLQAAGDPASLSIEATAKYELAAKDKFVTSFLDPWATKAADVVTTSWNPTLESKQPVDKGVAATVSGIKGLITK
jgi:ABC-type glycerol-3-phosphate transport system substrate-binding protein